MKKMTAVLLSAAMACSLMACGGASESAAPAETPAVTEETPVAEAETPAESEEASAAEAEETQEAAKDSYTFGYIAYDMTDIWNEYSARAFEYAGTQAGVKVETVVLDSKNSLEESVTAME